MAQHTLARAFLDSVTETLASTKGMGEGVLRQLSGEEMVRVVGPPEADLNSIGVIVRHLRGNMLSRWTDFLTTDGEKPGRRRDTEFVEEGVARETVVGWWDEGWACVEAAIGALTPQDLDRTVLIRGKPHSVPRAILRQIEHYGYHVGQMVVIGKMLKGAEWQTLTVPRGGSVEFNRAMGYEEGTQAQRHEGTT
jgi:hypothetical protein